jgi:hypothetical protein
MAIRGLGLVSQDSATAIALISGKQLADLTDYIFAEDTSTFSLRKPLLQIILAAAIHCCCNTILGADDVIG